jgi:hypothetical protein
VISGFRHDVYEIWALLGFYTVQNANSVLMFRHNLSLHLQGLSIPRGMDPSWTARPMTNAFFVDCLTLEDGTDGLSINISIELLFYAV